jgi:hypothetical protein
MYGYERAYRSMMGLGQLFTSKYCKKFYIEDKNTKRICILWKNYLSTRKEYAFNHISTQNSQISLGW